jgi:hypothetical protein
VSIRASDGGSLKLPQEVLAVLISLLLDDDDEDDDDDADEDEDDEDDEDEDEDDDASDGPAAAPPSLPVAAVLAPGQRWPPFRSRRSRWHSCHA